MSSLLNFIKSLFDSIFARRYKVFLCEDLPDQLKDKCLYILGKDQPWSAAFLCPCGCRSVIQLSLLAEDSPSWRLTIDQRGRPTLYPSVFRTVGCRSHFFLRDGLVIFVDGHRSFFIHNKPSL